MAERERAEKAIQVCLIKKYVWEADGMFCQKCVKKKMFMTVHFARFCLSHIFLKYFLPLYFFII